ncbi:MAG: hypothetical protein OXG98_19650 [Gemmatimonadetes bacterium]|nr:hypothetical protein [Gemmatimonadota bacterium]
MRWFILLLVASISFPATAQEGPEYEKLIQRSLTLENPEDGKREEVEKRFRAIWPKLHTLCDCKPAEIGDVPAKAWDEVKKAELKDGFLDTVEMFHRTVEGVRRELDSAGAFTPSLQICQQYADLYVGARRETKSMEEASKALVEMIHNLIGDEH